MDFLQNVVAAFLHHVMRNRGLPFNLRLLIDRAVILTADVTGETTRCLILTGDHLQPMIAPGNWNQPALPGNASAAIRITTATIVSSRIRSPILSGSQLSEGDGASAFAA